VLAGGSAVYAGSLIHRVGMSH